MKTYSPARHNDGHGYEADFPGIIEAGDKGLYVLKSDYDEQTRAHYKLMDAYAILRKGVLKGNPSLLWLSMDTAPKDGTMILVYSEDGEVRTTEWVHNGGNGFWLYGRDYLQPLGWQPLPKPPAAP
jgi:hypothetical protein